MRAIALAVTGSAVGAAVCTTGVSAAWAAGAAPTPTAPASVAAPAADPQPAAGALSTRVRFRAERVEMDFDHEWLTLSGGVEVQAERWRLWGQRFVVDRGRWGVHVQGEGHLAACACPDPPLSLGFSGAWLAPPTDLLVEDPTLRLWGMPVFWLPWAWVRSPDRPGVLPPTIAWRGPDGLFAGAGVHLPWGPPRDPWRSALDLSLGGYLEGGAEVGVVSTTPATALRGRLVLKEGALLSAETSGRIAAADPPGPDAPGTSSGAAGRAPQGGGPAHARTRRGAGSPPVEGPMPPTPTLAWRAGVLRGRGARDREPALESAARRHDRAEVGFVNAGRAGVSGVGAFAVTDRGGGLGAPAWLGQRLTLDAGDAWGASAAWELGAEAAMAGQGAESRGWVGPHLALRGAQVLGVAVLQGSAEAEARWSSGLASTLARPVAAVGLDLGVPLRGADGGAQHWLEPAAVLRLETEATTPIAPAPRWYAGGRARHAVAWTGDREALSLAAAVAAIGGGQAAAPVVSAPSQSSAPRPGGAARLVDAARWLGAGLEGAAEGWESPAWNLVGTARIGSVDALALTSGVAARRGGGASGARGLLVDRPADGLLDSDGVTWSGGLEIAPHRAWQLVVGATFDAVGGDWLGHEGVVTWRHPCACLALLGRASQRVGRRGVDAGAALDLAP